MPRHSKFLFTLSIRPGARASSSPANRARFGLVRTLLLAAALTCLHPVSAQDGTATGADAATAPLQGGVKGTTISMAVFLRELGDNCHHIYDSLKVVLAEVERRDMVAAGGPNLIGNMVIPATPSPSGVVAMGGYLPPRKKWLDFFTAQVQGLVTMTQSESAALAAGELTADQTAILSELRAHIHNLSDEQKALAASIQGPKYENMKIAEHATAIQDEVKQIEKVRKKLLRVMKSR